MSESIKKVYGQIYCITNQINGKISIGKTIRKIQVRLKEHFYDSKKGKNYLSHAIRKYGKENFSIREIDVAYNKEELNELEQYYIDFFSSSFRKIGYNMTFGGEGEVPNEEIRKKMSERMSGKNNPMYGRTGEESPGFGRTGEKHPMYGQIGEKSIWFGRHHSETSRKKMSESRKGEKNHRFGVSVSIETRILLREINTGENNPMYGRKGKNNLLSKKVICVETGEKFDAIKDVERKYNYNHGNISQCCINNQKTAYGFHWKSFLKEDN